MAKTANLLQDEFDVGPGSTVAVALPVHWQTAAVLLAVWSCGAAVLDTAAEDDGRLAEADVVLAAADRLAALEELEAPPSCSVCRCTRWAWAWPATPGRPGTSRSRSASHGDVFIPVAAARRRRRRSGARRRSS